MEHINFCPNCGNKTIPGAKFCTNCGKSLQTFERIKEPERPKVESEQIPDESVLNNLIEKYFRKTKNYFRKSDREEIESELRKLNYEQFKEIKKVSLRSPILVIFMSIFCTGVDRILIKDYDKGILKIALWIITSFLALLDLSDTMYVLFLIFYVGVLIYYIVDIFLCRRDTYQYNYENIMHILLEKKYETI